MRTIIGILLCMIVVSCATSGTEEPCRAKEDKLADCQKKVEKLEKELNNDNDKVEIRVFDE